MGFLSLNIQRSLTKNVIHFCIWFESSVLWPPSFYLDFSASHLEKIHMHKWIGGVCIYIYIYSLSLSHTHTHTHTHTHIMKEKEHYCSTFLFKIVLDISQTKLAC